MLQAWYYMVQGLGVEGLGFRGFRGFRRADHCLEGLMGATARVELPAVPGTKAAQARAARRRMTADAARGLLLRKHTGCSC